MMEGVSSPTLATPHDSYICMEYSLWWYRMSAYMATNVKAQYAPHHALLVTPNQTKHRNGITRRIMAKAIS